MKCGKNSAFSNGGFNRNWTRTVAVFHSKWGNFAIRNGR